MLHVVLFRVDDCQHIRNRIAAGEQTLMTELAGSPEQITAVHIQQAFDRGGPMAKWAVEQMAQYLAVWLYNLYQVLNINCFVFGGGLVHFGDRLFPRIRELFDQYNGNDLPVYFKFAELGGQFWNHWRSRAAVFLMIFYQLFHLGFYMDDIGGLLMSHFGELTTRMHDFREELLNAKPMVCVERAKITTQTYRENMDQPLAIRRALMYRNVLNGMSIFIEPQTLLAGNQGVQQPRCSHFSRIRNGLGDRRARPV